MTADRTISLRRHLMPLLGAWTIVIACLAVWVVHHHEAELMSLGVTWALGLAAMALGGRVIGRDLDERDRIVAKLESSESALSTTGALARVGGWMFDPNTLEVSWTDETRRIHEVPPGFTPRLEEAIGFYHPDDRSMLEGVIRRAIDHGEPYDVEFRLITAKGRRLWARSICEPKIVDGKTVLLSGAVQDTTRSKTAEIRLLEEEQRYHALFDNATDAMFIAQGGVIRFANIATERYLGASQEELLTTDFIEFIHKEDRAMVAERHAQRLQGLAPPDTYPFRIISPDGGAMWMELKAGVITWYGKPATVCVMRDIANRRRTEEQLEQNRRHLQELVDERTAELRQIVDLMAGREVRMADLKDEIRDLRLRLSAYEDQGIGDDGESGARK